MATVDTDKMVEPWMERLHLPGYLVSEAARYVGVHPNTISSWHYRGDPVLPGRTKGRPLSYLELIEVAFVAFFRNLDIDMELIRSARNYRDFVKGDGWIESREYQNALDYVQGFAETETFAFSVEESEARDFSLHDIETKYPFASLRFKAEGLHILTEYHKLDPWAQKWDKSMNSETLKRLNWVHITENQFADFDYDHGIVIRWHPAGRDSQVMIDPRMAFGDPMVSGLPTWVIHGRYIAGETIPEIEDDFLISESAILDALRFEGIQVS